VLVVGTTRLLCSNTTEARDAATASMTISTDSAGLRVLSCQDELAVGEIDTVLIVIWRGAVTLPRFTRQQLALEDLVARHPGRAGFLCIIEPDVQAPDEYLRRKSAEMIDAFGPRLRGVLCVIEATGFLGSVTRSVLSGMALLLTSGSPARKFSESVEAGGVWLVRHCPDTTPGRLSRAVAALRARLGENMLEGRS
jgi:hypothetical protein